jgi:hypothetical protein
METWETMDLNQTRATLLIGSGIERANQPSQTVG